MKKMLLLLVILADVLISDIIRDSNGIITDTTTNLMWQDDYSDNGGSIKKAIWMEAVNYCEALTLGGYDDWRLPNIRELTSIVDDSKYSPAINPVFQYTAKNIYWSSTTASYVTNGYHHAWYINFNNGGQSRYSEGNSNYVRCIRGGL